MSERVILHGLDDADGKIAAVRAVAADCGLEPGEWIGIRIGATGRAYSVTRNKGGFTVRSADAPTDNTTKEG